MSSEDRADNDEEIERLEIKLTSMQMELLAERMLRIHPLFIVVPILLGQPLNLLSYSLNARVTSQEVNLLMIGKTGNGKSATGNSILQKQVFEENASTTSITMETQSDVTYIEGRKVMVVDTPGVGDTEMTEERAVLHVQKALMEAMSRSKYGYNAFLLVLRYGARFTTEEKKTICRLKDMLGADFVKNYCIVVMTCGDMFESDSKNSGDTFEDWCFNQTGEFKRLLEECQNRVVLVNNRETDEREEKAQISKLLALVDKLSHGLYNVFNYKKAEPSRKRLMLEIREPQIQRETSEKVKELREELSETNETEDLDRRLSILRDLHGRAKTLSEDLKKKDGATGVLQMAIESAALLEDNIDRYIEICQNKIMEDYETLRRARREEAACRVQ